MAITVWPVNASNGGPAVAGRGLRQTSVGVPLAGATAGRPLGVRSGVRPGTPATTVTYASGTVAVGPHAGVIDGQTAAEAGGYEYSSDGAVPVASNLTADASNPRIDLVSVQVSDPSESDGTAAASVQFIYTQGTAAASPLAPGDAGAPVAAPPRSFPLARVNVPKSGGGTPTVSWVAPYMAAAAGVLPVDTLANLRALSGVAGQYATVFADPTTANNGLYRWNSATSRWDNAAQQHWLSAWYNTGSGSGSYKQVAGVAPIFQGGQALGTTTSAGVLSHTFPNPFPNGILGVILMPTQASGFAAGNPPYLVEASLSQTGFQSFWPSKGSSSVNVPYVAIGW